MSDNVERTLGRIESKIETLLEQQSNMNERVNALESLKDKAMGYAIGAAAVFTAFWHYIPKAVASIIGGH